MMLKRLRNFAVGGILSYFFNKALEGALEGVQGGTHSFPSMKLFDVPGTWGYGLDDIVATLGSAYVAGEITDDYLMSGLGSLVALILDKHLIEPAVTGLIKLGGQTYRGRVFHYRLEPVKNEETYVRRIEVLPVANTSYRQSLI